MTNRFVHVPVVDIIKTFNKTFDLTEIEQRYILTHCQPADYPINILGFTNRVVT